MADNAHPVIDAHIHQWDPFTTPRKVSTAAKVARRAPFLLPIGLRMFPRADREFIGDPQFVLNPYLPVDYRADSAPASVGTVVHIEAEWQGKNPLAPVDETRWVSALPFGVAGAPTLGAIVVHADPAQPGISGLLDAHLEASALVRGVRCMASHSADPGVMDWNKSAHLFTEPAFLRGFAAVAERGLSFEMWVYGDQLPDTVVLAREYPDTTFVLDHYGSPVGVLGPRGKHTGVTAADRRNILQRWRDDISSLAELPNVVAKTFGHRDAGAGGRGHCHPSGCATRSPHSSPISTRHSGRTARCGHRTIRSTRSMSLCRKVFQYCEMSWATASTRPGYFATTRAGCIASPDTRRPSRRCSCQSALAGQLGGDLSRLRLNTGVRFSMNAIRPS